MRKYSLKRIPHPSIKVGPKTYLTSREVKELFKGPVTVEEKLDGSQMAIGFKHGEPYVQTKNSHLLENDKRIAFKGAWNWVWSNYDTISRLQGYLLFGEWLYIQHNIHYDLLPEFFIVFDVWDEKRKRFLSILDKHEFLRRRGLWWPPVIVTDRKFSGEGVYNWINNRHTPFAVRKTLNEGAVVKNYGRKVMGKMVLQEFIDEIDEAHWTSHSPKYNRLARASGYYHYENLGAHCYEKG